jgi:SAM-dependent methyltransferase
MGRITIPLARSELKMTGVDVTPGFIRGAMAAARRVKVKARFFVADMRRLAFDGEFDAAFNWFTSWGYFTDRENLDALRRIRRALRPGGRFLVEGMNKSWVVRHLNLGRNMSRIGGVEVIQQSHWAPKTSRMSTLWELRRGRRVERHRIRVLVYDGAGIRRILQTAGFRDVKLYGRGGAPFSRHSRRIIAVATRPG